MNHLESVQAWQADRAFLASRGVEMLPSVSMYTPDEHRYDYNMAMDAQPSLTTDPNNGIPVFLTTMIDPAVFKILFAPVKAAKILGENRKGTWLDTTAIFPTVEHTGEVSSYGDYNENGVAGANTNFPQRQAYLFQIIKEYGERELEMAGLARINWVSELDQSAAGRLAMYSNLTYFYGVNGLQNYGLFNDANLSAALTPSTKAEAGYGTKWIVNGVPCAANEIYQDIQNLFYTLVTQTSGLVDQDSKMCLAMSPGSAVALTATNSFNVNVYDLLKKNFPNIRFETAVQYGVISTANPNGQAAGNFVQLIADETEGQQTGYMAFNEKMRAHPIIRATSSFKQKLTAGTWGAIIRMPVNISSMIGV
jgi:hypothetical protein